MCVTGFMGDTFRPVSPAAKSISARAARRARGKFLISICTNTPWENDRIVCLPRREISVVRNSCKNRSAASIEVEIHMVAFGLMAARSFWK